ncbi:hypothetical protein [Flexibacterium corallicola]|uniref:hypothetical protein n=1 Tax=Flexibacterium corallicola TaxID=3037259 RepID=UPI00286EFD2F|nr:hypothetical protein [Pseudovibrio sp. M1P-2-3]
MNRSSSYIPACIVVGLLSLPSSALASGAIIMTDLICQDPRDSIDTLWASRRYGANDVFFMANDGTVTAMEATAGLDTFENVYVVSHGSEDEVGNIPKADFAQYFKAAHPSTPATVYFDSCSTAVGVDTVLKLTNNQYGDDIAALLGPQGACQLVGNGNPAVADADNRYNAALLPGNDFQTVVDNILFVWNNEDYVDSGRRWGDACQNFVDTNDLQNLNTFRLAVQDKFLNAPQNPVNTSYNYGWLIQWNTGGTNFFQCGTQNGVACP